MPGPRATTSIRRCAAAAAAAVLLAAPAAARAATFSVQAAAAADPVTPCVAPAAPCQTIGKAVTFARATPEADTILVGPGTYPEYLALNDVADAGLTVAGAGSGADPASATIVAPAADVVGPGAIITLGGPAVGGQALRSLRVRHLPAVNDKNGVGISGAGTAVADVTVEVVSDAPDQGIGFAVGRAATLDRVAVEGTYDGQGINLIGSAPFGVAVRDSVIRAGTSKTAVSVGAQAALVLQRTVLLRPGPTGAVLTVNGGPAQNAAAAADSSLLLGGATGVALGTGTGTVTATLRHVTIDAGAPGPGAGLAVDATAAGGTAAAALASSVALEPMAAAGGATVACTFSDVPPQAAGGVSCGPAGGNSQTPVASLMPGLAAGRYELAPNSPAIDAGAPGGLAPDESPTDFAGSPRIADAGGDCAARRDRGAFERPGLSLTPLVTAAPVFRPAVFAVAAAGGADGPLAFRWNFGTGPVLSGPVVRRSFTAPGPIAATVTATDGRGCATSAAVGFTVAPDTIRPAVTRLALSRRVLAPRGARSRARLRLTLSEPGSVTVDVQQARAGRRVGRRCLAPARARRARPRCTRWTRAGLLRTVRSRAGATTVGVGVRIGTRRLAPGVCRLRITATDRAGNRSVTHTVAFRVAAH